jgi:crotonobetaine/carnitine-CoA ligase
MAEGALDRDRILPRLVECRAREDGDRPFLRTVSGATVTYADAHDLARRWAAAFGDVGVDKDDTVGVMLPVSIDAVMAWLGLAWIGAWEVPLNEDYRGRMLGHVLSDARVTTAIVAERYLDRILEVEGQVPTLRQIIVVGGTGLPGPSAGVPVRRIEDLIAGARPGPLTGPEPWDVACIIYTSGTTGPSKGVVVPWAQMLATVDSPLLAELGPEDHRYSPFPLFHISGKSLVYGAALSGAQVVLRERFSVTDFWADVARYGCTMTWLVGAMPTLLHSRPETAQDRETPLRYAVMAPVMKEYRDFERRFGTRIATVYNMSELSMPIVSGWDLPNHRTCGRPRAGYDVRIVDEHDLPLGPGEFGEIVVRSDTPWTMNLGYLHQPEKSAEAWRHGWFHTGDGGMYDEDGNFYFADRIKDAIRRRGENVSSMEVEAEVLAHPAVAECAAIGVPSPLGEEDIAVLVVARPEHEVDPAGLWDFLEERMPRFMLPRYVRIVDALPKTVTQKVRKVELRGMFEADTSTWDREMVLGLGTPSRPGL